MLVWAWSGDVSAVSADLPSRLWNAVALARDETNIFHRALHYTEVPAAIGVVRRSGALPVTKLSLEFLVLTAARSGEGLMEWQCYSRLAFFSASACSSFWRHSSIRRAAPTATRYAAANAGRS